MATSDREVILNKEEPMAQRDFPPAYTAQSPVPYPSVPMTTQPVAPSTHQLTVVQTGSPIIAEVRPQDYLVMSILNCIFCNCILGIIAIIFSSMSATASDSGNLRQGRSHGRVAFWLNIASFIINAVFGLLFVILWFTVFAVAASEVSHASFTCGTHSCDLSEYCCGTSYYTKYCSYNYC